MKKALALLTALVLLIACLVGCGKTGNNGEAVQQEEELYSIVGGGPLGDALDLFFNNLRLDDFFFSGGLISFSFTFVPLLLFNVVKTGFNFVVGAYDTISNLFHFSREEKEMVEYLSDQQQRKQQAQNQTNSFLPGADFI